MGSKFTNLQLTDTNSSDITISKVKDTILNNSNVSDLINLSLEEAASCKIHNSLINNLVSKKTRNTEISNTHISELSGQVAGKF